MADSSDQSFFNSARDAVVAATPSSDGMRRLIEEGRATAYSSHTTLNQLPSGVIESTTSINGGPSTKKIFETLVANGENYDESRSTTMQLHIAASDDSHKPVSDLQVAGFLDFGNRQTTINTRARDANGTTSNTSQQCKLEGTYDSLVQNCSGTFDIDGKAYQITETQDAPRAKVATTVDNLFVWKNDRLLGVVHSELHRDFGHNSLPRSVDVKILPPEQVPSKLVHPSEHT